MVATRRRAAAAASAARVVPYNELPAWRKQLSDPAIVHGFRRDYTLVDAFFSMFHRNNEQLNVWTHFLGLIVNHILMWHGLNGFLKDAAWPDRAAFLAFSLATQFQMFASSFFHLTLCVSREWYLFGARLDYLAIATTIFGCMIQPFYYGLYCHPKTALFYLVSMAGACGYGAATAFNPNFHSVAMRKTRIYVFVAIGFLALPAIPHLFAVSPLPTTGALDGALLRALRSVAFYMIGVAIMVTRVPERCMMPGACDLGCQSHAVWHICVLIAQLFHYELEVYMYETIRPMMVAVCG